MPRFYCPDIATTLTLTEDESRHCVRVLRLAEGDSIEVVDGRGNLYTCRISMAHPKRCAIEVTGCISSPPHWGCRIVLAVAPTKMLDRMEWMVEKCVEMGVDRIVPLRCHNSERTEIKTERLKRVMVAAMKQSLKATLPQIDEMTPLVQLLQQPWEGDRFMAYCDPELPREQRQLLPQLCKSGRDVMVLIGPEGDFSPEEVAAALAAGVVPVSLGESRLRTETAAVMACAGIHVVNMLGKQ
ncbi:MAG: 16S rRNA (uracil(1498)-N(3))-methyltransferase [Muribaculaceae bacterium]|nr:16S rRNA (uracil(1498)-N(3))-methyltransferase [Muribaculaceae bacterium]MBR3102072.1 16S rRNA (uracil(1498)-N(3))-methyltransferase [Muribaculaceae bacterium]